MLRVISSNSYAAVLRGLRTHCVVRMAHTHPDYLLGPGKHLPSSPVVGARSKEFNRLSYAVMHHPLLNELGRTIYDIKYRLIIPEQERDKANTIARELFLNYIKKYAPYGITELNIVNWISTTRLDAKGSGRCSVLKQDDTPYIDLCVDVDNGVNYREKGFFTPPHIIAYHEVMHAEEYKKNLFLYAYGREMITTIKSIILLDDVFKQIHDADLSDEINYKKSIVIHNRKIPLGRFVNFYRVLEKKHGNLGDAIVSTQSIRFLESGSEPILSVLSSTRHSSSKLISTR